MSARRSLARALGAEAIGTFALVFAGAGAVMVDAKTGAPGHVGIALTFGLVIAAMVYAVEGPGFTRRQGPRMPRDMRGGSLERGNDGS